MFNSKNNKLDNSNKPIILYIISKISKLNVLLTSKKIDEFYRLGIIDQLGLGTVNQSKFKLEVLDRLDIFHMKNYLNKLDELNRLGNLGMFDNLNKTDTLNKLCVLKSLSITAKLIRLREFDEIDRLNILNILDILNMFD